MIEKKLANNPLRTRQEVAQALLDLIRPLKPFYSQGNAWLKVGDTGAHYGEKSARMESYARILWGLGPLFAQENSEFPRQMIDEINEWKERYVTGLIHGTDKESKEYWGRVNDYDQKMVEMAAIVVAISLAPNVLWNSLTQQQKNNVYQWLNQINEKKVHPNNWRFFRILVNMTFERLGLDYSTDNLRDDLQVIENCYSKDGWYYDGNPGQLDYYIPFAMHFYGLIYAVLKKDIDTEYKNTLLDRAAKFSKEFIYWFSEEGNEIPYGRSLTYRFAHSAFFAALAYSKTDCGISYGVMKKMVLGNLRTWMKRPIFDQGGVLTIGYGYPNIFMSERYNAPGSPYWSFKTFLILALPESHPFWQAKEETYYFQSKKKLDGPHMLVTHDSNQHVCAYTTGQHCMNHGSIREKYEKFVYSNQFGFSVSRGTGLEDGAFDNTIAISRAGEDNYQMRYGVKEFRVTEDMVESKYNITNHVSIESRIIPMAPWHIRIHHIKTEIAIDLCDGGFAIPVEPMNGVVVGEESGKYQKDSVIKQSDGIFAKFPWGLSGAATDTAGDSRLIHAFPNTNLFANLTCIPSIVRTLEPGEYTLIHYFIGDCSNENDYHLNNKPMVSLLADGKVVVNYFNHQYAIE